MRYGQARPQEQGAFDSGRYRRHHPAATQPRRRFRAPQSKTGCAEAHMTRMEEHEQDKHSTRRSHSMASTLGSLMAACRWGQRQGVDTYAHAVWCAQHEPVVPCSGLRRSAAADDATGTDAVPNGTRGHEYEDDAEPVHAGIHSVRRTTAA